MPIYEYECQKCGTAFELMQSINARPPKSCVDEKCKGKPRRLVSRGGFILKGTGWYATDYPTESRKKGWEQENGKTKEAPAEGGKSATTAEAAEAPSTPASSKESSLTKAQNKNPYTGGSKKSKKAAKASQ
ncbi:MAG: zinc ribbon domain-containing protein [Nitrospina sp.]|nr:MAG: zinc ribbon domain-containing protein [Nitrospina sp.]TDJ57747.1 MAG: zinc ribbon domain-containing protein [Nitrospina sp.]